MRSIRIKDRGFPQFSFRNGLFAQTMLRLRWVQVLAVVLVASALERSLVASSMTFNLGNECCNSDSEADALFGVFSSRRSVSAGQSDRLRVNVAPGRAVSDRHQWCKSNAEGAARGNIDSKTAVGRFVCGGLPFTANE